MPHPCQPPSSHFRPGSSPRHTELARCHPEPSTCHPELARCHPGSSRCHPDLPPCHPEPSSCHPDLPPCHPEPSSCNPDLPPCHPEPSSCHPDLSPCDPEPPSCHPDPSSCHPEPPSCHPERSEGSAVFLARGRARLLPSLFAAREKGSAGTSPSLAKLPGTPGPSKNSDDSLRADCFVRRGGLVMTPQRKQSLRAKRSNPASSSVLESCHTGSCSSLRAKRSNLIALNGDSLSWATR